MHAEVGMVAIQRKGTLKGGGGDLPCYCGEGGSGSPPFFPAFYLNVEVFPGAYARKGSFIEGLACT
ncbi:MAG: hypothetical protein R3C68_06000 [Myxococcota bacterium]